MSVLKTVCFVQEKIQDANKIIKYNKRKILQNTLKEKLILNIHVFKKNYS